MGLCSTGTNVRSSGHNLRRTTACDAPTCDLRCSCPCCSVRGTSSDHLTACDASTCDIFCTCCSVCSTCDHIRSTCCSVRGTCCSVCSTCDHIRSTCCSVRGTSSDHLTACDAPTCVL